MKTRILNYSFVKGTAGNGTVTFSDYTTISLDRVLLITDVTRNAIIYNSADSAKGGTVATNVLTLAADTSAYSNSDKLQIFYDDDVVGRSQISTFRAHYTAAQTNVQVIAGASGTRIVVTRVSILSSNAVTVNVSAVVGFGASTTPTGAGVLASHPNIAPGSGIQEGNGQGVLGIGADGQSVFITCSVPTTDSIDVLVTYYTLTT